MPIILKNLLKSNTIFIFIFFLFLYFFAFLFDQFQQFGVLLEAFHRMFTFTKSCQVFGLCLCPFLRSGFEREINDSRIKEVFQNLRLSAVDCITAKKILYKNINILFSYNTGVITPFHAEKSFNRSANFPSFFAFSQIFLMFPRCPSYHLTTVKIDSEIIVKRTFTSETNSFPIFYLVYFYFLNIYAVSFFW